MDFRVQEKLGRLVYQLPYVYRNASFDEYANESKCISTKRIRVLFARWCFTRAKNAYDRN